MGRRDVAETVQRTVYGAAYVPSFVVWNTLGKHTWRLVLRPCTIAMRDVIQESEEKDARRAALSSVSVDEAYHALFVAVFNKAKQIAWRAQCSLSV